MNDRTPTIKTVTLDEREYTLTFDADQTLTGISYIDGTGRRRDLSVNGKVAKQALATLDELRAERKDGSAEQYEPAILGTEHDLVFVEEAAVNDPGILDRAKELLGKTAEAFRPTTAVHPAVARRVRRAWEQARAMKVSESWQGANSAMGLLMSMGAFEPSVPPHGRRHATPERMPVGRKAGSYGRGLMNHFARERQKALQARRQ